MYITISSKNQVFNHFNSTKITLLYKDSFSPIKLSNISMLENSFLTRIPFFQHVEKIVEKSMIKKKNRREGREIK